MQRLVFALILLCALPAGAMRHATVTLPGPDGITLTAELFLPDGPPRGAAVLGLHGCAGFRRADGRPTALYLEWARHFTAAGRAFLLPDSFASRGQGEQCTVAQRGILPRRERAADTLAAARWLSAQPFGLGRPVDVIGWSHGGSTVLWAAGGAGDAPIMRLVAFYPGCTALTRVAAWQPERPLLILIGEADDWTPAAPCAALAAREPSRIGYHAYPGAYHGFDAPNLPLRQRTGLAFTARGDGTAHLGTDHAARADAMARVSAFFNLER